MGMNRREFMQVMGTDRAMYYRSAVKFLVALHLCLFSGWLNAAQLRVGDTLVLPALHTLDGKVIDAASTRGKTVVISYFATDCPFCMNEAPQLQKLYRKNLGKLLVIGVNVQRNDPEQSIKAKQWVEKYKLGFPVTTDFTALESVLGKLKGLPVQYVIDRRGKVVRIDVGEIFDEDFDDIARLAR